MPRKGPAPRRELVPDPVHGSVLVTQVINKVLLHGKKTTAERIVYSALDIVADKTGGEPVVIADALQLDSDHLEDLLAPSLQDLADVADIHGLLGLSAERLDLDRLVHRGIRVRRAHGALEVFGGFPWTAEDSGEVVGQLGASDRQTGGVSDAAFIVDSNGCRAPADIDEGNSLLAFLIFKNAGRRGNAFEDDVIDLDARAFDAFGQVLHS